MSTGDAAKYCVSRTGVPCSESTLVIMNIVYSGLVDKQSVKEYIKWYKKNNLSQFAHNYPFFFIDETGFVHKEGYTPK